MNNLLDKFIVWCDKQILKLIELSTTHIEQEREEVVRCGPCYNCGEESIGTRKNGFRHSETGKILCFGLNKPEKAIPIQVHRENLLMGFDQGKDQA